MTQTLKGLKATQGQALEYAKQLLDEGYVVGIAYEVTDGLYHVHGDKPKRVHFDVPILGYPKPGTKGN